MEIVYNWHITQSCNFSCNYCFGKFNPKKIIYKDLSKTELLFDELLNIKKVSFFEELNNLHSITSFRINFAGGEPLLLGDSLYKVASLAKEKGFKTSLITNGSLLVKNIQIAKHMDMIGISIDSFNSDINRAIGRVSGGFNKMNKDYLSDVIDKLVSLNPSIKIKFNTVISEYNYNEEIVNDLLSFNPDKIKIFKVMNFGDYNSALTNVMFNNFLSNNNITDKRVFLEDNNQMTHSYLMIDPAGRFFQNGSSKYEYSDPIYSVGIEHAFESINFDFKKYVKRYYKEPVNEINSFN